MRNALFFCLLILAMAAQAQADGRYLFFSGYILDEDSIPIEGALLVNFRTLKPYITKEDGFFKLYVKEDDSLLINHIAYERKIIKPNALKADSNRFYLAFSPHEIKTVDINYQSTENMNSNMDLMWNQMIATTPSYQTGTEYNRYAPARRDQTFGINVVELYRWIKTYKYRKSAKKK